jgi:hypothetical protein
MRVWRGEEGSKRLLLRVNNGSGKGAPGTDMCSSIIDRMHMGPGSKLF